MKYKDKKIVYEVGDWVVLQFGTQIPETKIIRKVDSEGCIYYKQTSAYPCGYNNGTSGGIRPATQEEIDKVEDKIMIGEYEVEFWTGVGKFYEKIKVGCVEVSKETFLKIGKKAGWL